jgi:urease accessory protein
MRGARQFVMSNLKTLTGLADVVSFIETKGLLLAAA